MTVARQRSTRPPSLATGLTGGEITERLRVIQDRLADLQRDGADEAGVDQEVLAHLAAIEGYLGLGGRTMTPTAPRAEIPLLDTLARLSAVLDTLSGEPAPAQTAQPRTTALAPVDALHFPVNPSLAATVEGIFSNTARWEPDAQGKPHFTYVSHDQSGQITLSFAHDPKAADGVAALWEAVKSLNTETVDILLLLVSRIAELPNPRKDTTTMRLEEIAEAREVHLRDGSSTKLHDAFRDQILRLADLRLSIQWTNLDDDDTIDFAKDRPAHLLTIVDYTRRRRGETWRAFEFGCGPALACFMRQDDLRLVGQYSKALLRLNPYRQSLTKRVGVFYAFAGAASAKAGTPLAVTPRALLTFIGTEPDWEHPTRTIEGMVRAHTELFDIGLLATEPALAPAHRTRGYFETWLDQPFSVYLSSALYANLDGPATLEALPPAIEPARPRPPVDLAELRADPGRIRAFRVAHNLSLRELARVLKIAPMSLHRYEQGERTLPEPAAARLLSIWHERERRRDH